MSFTIPTSIVREYEAGLRLNVQQSGSKLRKAVDVDAGITGESKFYDSLSKVSATPRTSRHSRVQHQSTPHNRRMLSVLDYEFSDLLDRADEPKVLTDPRSSYAINGSRAMGRQMDQTIIDALLGTASTGKTGTGSASLTLGTMDGGQGATQGVGSQYQSSGTASGTDSALTLEKILGAKRILGANEAFDGNESWFCCSERQLEDLLADTSTNAFISIDFNSVRALMAGTITHFMGFNWVFSELLPTTTLTAGGTARRCIAWSQPALTLGIARDISATVERNPDYNATQILVEMSLGAVRREEEQVVEIWAKES